MPRLQTIDIDVADENLIGFASNVTGATWTITTTATSDSLAHRVSIRNDSATDHAGKTAILTGTDADGNAQTETVTLPGVSATIESTKYFLTLTSVVPSATIGADTMDIGWVDEVASKTLPLNRHGEIGALVQFDVTGTLNMDIEVTAADLRATYADQNAIPWINTSTTALIGATGDAIGNIEAGVVACRVVLNSYSSGAEVQAYISETSD